MEASSTRFVDGYLGHMTYLKQHDGDLVVPFQRQTFDLKDKLRALGFHCAYAEKRWKLHNATAEDEEALRHLLSTRSANPASPRAAPAAAAHAAAAAAPTGTPMQRGERKRGREEEVKEEVKEEDGGVPAAEQQQQPTLLFDGSVTISYEASGHVVLEGNVLHNIWQQLERVLHFQHLPAEDDAVPRWRSGFALNRREREFLLELLQHRQEKLVEDPWADDKEPLPPGVQLPPRFRPVGADGAPLKGPFTARNGMPHNRGRLFFNNDRNNGFIWADGTEPFSREAQQRFDTWAEDEGMGGPLPAMFGMAGGGGGLADQWDEEEGSGMGSEEEEDGEEEEEGEEEDEEEGSDGEE